MLGTRTFGTRMMCGELRSTLTSLGLTDKFGGKDRRGVSLGLSLVFRLDSQDLRLDLAWEILEGRLMNDNLMESQNEGSSARKGRFGGAANRVSHHTQALGSPLRVLVSSIGQKIAGKNPARKKADPTALGTKSSSSATPGRSIVQTNLSTPAGKKTSSLQLTPSKRQVYSSVPSKPASVSSATPLRKQTTSSNPAVKSVTTPEPSTKPAATHETVSTPVSKPSSIPACTPSKGNNPITPKSRRSSLPPRTPGKSQNILSTPIAKHPLRTPTGKQQTPSTTVSNQISIHPTTPVSGQNDVMTPVGKHNNTPKTSAARPSPLNPRDSNRLESSRKLHFGIDLSKVDWQRSPHRKENVPPSTPKAEQSAAVIDLTYSLDKNRLAAIRARQRSQLLRSPAQRVKVEDSFRTPSKPVQSLLETTPRSFTIREDEAESNPSPSRKRLDKSLWH